MTGYYMVVVLQVLYLDYIYHLLLHFLHYLYILLPDSGLILHSLHYTGHIITHTSYRSHMAVYYRLARLMVLYLDHSYYLLPYFLHYLYILPYASAFLSHISHYIVTDLTQIDYKFHMAAYYMLVVLMVLCQGYSYRLLLHFHYYPYILLPDFVLILHNLHYTVHIITRTSYRSHMAVYYMTVRPMV
jgi:hypothetical protein